MRARTWATGAILAATAYLTAARVAAAIIGRIETRDPDAEDLPGARFYIRGRRIYFTVEGRGPPLLLLHGLGMSGYAFRRITPYLRDHYTLITPDLPGFGYSDRDPQADHSYEAQAAVMNELLDRLNIGKVAVIGHSIGASIALRLAAARPERVVALALAGGPVQPGAVLPGFTRPFLPPFIALALRKPLLRRLYRAVLTTDRGPDAAAVAHYAAAGTVRGTAETWATILAGTRHGPAPLPATLPMPVLVMRGASDRRLTPKRAAALARGFPRGHLAVVPNCGHLLLEEQPEQSVTAILTLLERARP